MGDERFAWAAWTHQDYCVDMREPSEDAALLALLRTRPHGMSWPEIAQEVLTAGSAHALWESCHSDGLFAAPGADDELVRAQATLAEWEADGLGFLGVTSPLFPARVRSIRELPPFLMYRGHLKSIDPAVSVVGSRMASARTLEMTAGVAGALVAEGFTVLSGLAAGVDAAAHRAALAAGGRTVAVIGTGLNRSYPAENRDLQQTIASQGLVLSQFYPDGPPQRHNFLMRNAVMSGYGHATVVMEAGEHSGARAQARMAVEHGRPVILTETVVERNAWARALMGRPRVFAASSVADVLAAVSDIKRTEGEAAGLVARLVPEFA